MTPGAPPVERALRYHSSRMTHPPTTAAATHPGETPAGEPGPVRIGCVRYLNTLPLIEGLEKLADVSLAPAPPCRLAGMLASGEVDVALVSLIDAQRHGFTILPVGAIGCDGPTMTVRLYSAEPIENITRVHADAESHTAAALVRIVLFLAHGVRPEVVEFDVRERMADAGPLEWPDALLMIGDKVVTDSPPAIRYPHQLDLGEAWKKLTGLPFVYAAWMCRAGEQDTPSVRTARVVLDRARRHNATRADWVVTRRAASRNWPADLAREYLNDLLRYDPPTAGSRQRRAVERFFDEAAALGLLDQRSPTRYAD